MSIFSILVITYNRPQLLKECLNSLKEQTFSDFEVCVLDRGSEPSVESIVKTYDSRFKYFQSYQDIHIVDGGNSVISKMHGKYFLHLADDDLICRDTLENVYNGFNQYKECDVVQVGLIGYDYFLNKNNIDYEHFSRHSKYKFNDLSAPKFEILNGSEICQEEWSCSCILINNDYEKKKSFTRLHPSSLFFKLDKLKAVSEIQNGPFLKPMWDIGTHNLIYKSKVLYINKPLAIVSESSDNRESLASRRRWAKELVYVDILPYKIPSISIIFIETILKVIKINKLTDFKNITIAPELYFRLRDEIFMDNPYTVSTMVDSLKVDFIILKSLIFNFPKTINQIIKNTKFSFLYKNLFLHIKIIIYKYTNKQKYKKYTDKTYLTPTFESITEYRKFIESKYFGFQNG